MKSVCFALIASTSCALASDATVPGQVTTPFPIVPWTNRLSGSIFDLQPDTTYEIELNLSDPDGGSSQKLVVARTRPVPTEATNARVTNAGPRGFKLHRFSQGDVVLHNTVVKAGDGLGNYTSEPFDHALFRNNLFVGGKASNATFGGYSPGRGRAVDVQQFGLHCSFDHNAYGTHGIPFEGKFRSWTFTKLPGTEFEPHGLQIHGDPIELFKKPMFPSDPSKTYGAPDLRPAALTSVLDIAAPIPNVNSIYSGDGPDLGAYESDQQLPVYGPRP